MKKILSAAVAAAAVFMLSSCFIMISDGGLAITGSGTLSERNFYYTGFDSVNASSVCRVVITESDEFKITASIDDNLADYVEITKDEDELCVGLRSGYSYNFSSFTVYITMPGLRAVELSGASDVRVNGFDSDDLISFDLSEASRGTVYLDSAVDLSASVSQASSLFVSSNIMSGDLEIECGGASTADFRNCTADDVLLDVEGASTVYIESYGLLNGWVTEASSLYYRGAPDLNSISLSGASSMSSF